MNKKTSILIVTFEKDFHWLKWCLRSIEKFAAEFYEVVIAVPGDEDWKLCRELSAGYHGPVSMRWHTYDDWPDAQFNHHMERLCHADEICSSADFILHMDADCIFTSPVIPDDYFVQGKPVLIGAPYAWVVEKFQNHYHLKWKEAVENALGGVSQYEFMRRHPAVHYKRLYSLCRELMQKHTGKNPSDYIRSVQGTFPHGFAEFPTLGEVAFRHFRNDYNFLFQPGCQWPEDKLMQFWSHGPMDAANNVWKNGGLISVIPNEVFKQLLM